MKEFNAQKRKFHFITNKFLNITRLQKKKRFIYPWCRLLCASLFILFLFLLQRKVALINKNNILMLLCSVYFVLSCSKEGESKNILKHIGIELFQDLLIARYI